MLILMRPVFKHNSFKFFSLIVYCTKKKLFKRCKTLISKFSIDFNLILSLLNIGTKNLSTFVNSSMLTNELNKEKEFLKEKIQTLVEK